MKTRNYILIAVLAILFSGVLDLVTTLLCLSTPPRNGLRAVELNPHVASQLSEYPTRYYALKCLIPALLFSTLAWCHARSVKYNIRKLRLVIEGFTIGYTLLFAGVVVNNLLIFLILRG